MPRAIWKGTVVAEAPADKVQVVEGNIYFPRDSIRAEHFEDSATHTVCSWKGTASYFNVVVNGEINKDAAWYYPEPKAAAKEITGHVAFWRGVQVER